MRLEEHMYGCNHEGDDDTGRGIAHLTASFRWSRVKKNRPSSESALIIPTCALLWLRGQDEAISCLSTGTTKFVYICVLFSFLAKLGQEAKQAWPNLASSKDFGKVRPIGSGETSRGRLGTNTCSPASCVSWTRCLHETPRRLQWWALNMIKWDSNFQDGYLCFNRKSNYPGFLVDLFKIMEMLMLIFNLTK